MRQKGFTLVELLGALVLLSLIVLIAFPAIVSVVKRSNNKISAATEALIIGAAKEKVEQEKNNYPLTNGNVFCETIQTLIDEDYLISDLQAGSTDEEVDEDTLTSKVVKIEVSNLKYTFTIVDATDCTQKIGS